MSNWDEHVQQALLVAYDVPVEPSHRVPGMFVVDGPVIEPDDEVRSVLSWRSRWLEKLTATVDERRAWGVLGIRDEDAALFDTSADGLFRCAGWATSARMIVPKGRGARE